MKYNEMIVTPLFAAPFMRTKLDDIYLDTYRSFALIQRARGKDNDIIKSNIGGWHSENLDHRNPTNINLLQKIGKPIDKFLDYYHINREKYGWEYSESWFIINEKGHYNVPHIHPNSFLSGVFYIQTSDKSGDIIFHHHAKNIDYHKQSKDAFNKNEGHNSDTWKVTPENGDLFVFPSFLYHSVEENKTNDYRIILSFNINLIEEK